MVSNKMITFPDRPGTYVAIHNGMAILCKFVGWFPCVELKAAIDISNMFTNFFSEPTILDKKPASKDIINSIIYDRGLWKFYDILIGGNTVMLDSFNRTVVEELTAIETEEEYDLFKIYCRILSAGISWTKMIGVIRTRINCSHELALELIKKFDEKRYASGNNL